MATTGRAHGVLLGHWSQSLIILRNAWLGRVANLAGVDFETNTVAWLASARVACPGPRLVTVWVHGFCFGRTDRSCKHPTD